MIQPRPSTGSIASVPQPVRPERMGAASTGWDVALLMFGVPGSMVLAVLSTWLVMSSAHRNPLWAATGLATVATIYGGTMFGLWAGSVAYRPSI